MASGKGIILGLAGIGVAGLLLKAASSKTSAPVAKQQTYVEKTLAKSSPVVAKAKGKVATAKSYAAKGTAEAQAAIDAVNKILKS